MLSWVQGGIQVSDKVLEAWSRNYCGVWRRSIQEKSSTASSGTGDCGDRISKVISSDP